MFDKETQMEMRAEKAAETLGNHPSVAYADYNKDYSEVWCGLLVNTTEGVEDIVESFGLVDPKIQVENNSEYGLVIDIWWNVSNEYLNDWRWRDVNDWIENYNYSTHGDSLVDVVDE